MLISRAKLKGFTSSYNDQGWVFTILAISAYTFLCILIIPGNAEFTYGFNHDSAYLVTVARNLVAGRGYVNDAHWMVFLNPDSLPVPYHNANPLYPTLMAAYSILTHSELTYSGFLISALSSGLLVLAVTFLVKPYTGSLKRAALLGFCAAIFPPVLQDSMTLMTDALVVALFFTFLAAVIRIQIRWASFIAGISLGLAWLTRSQVVLALPAVLVYMILQWGWKRGSARFVWIILVAMMVASPWLVHTYQVWGNPLRSDASYYLMQDYHAQHNGQIPTDSVKGFWKALLYYWHSPKDPIGIIEVVKNNPLQFVNHTIKGIPEVLRETLRHWSMKYITDSLNGFYPWPRLMALIVGACLGLAALYFCMNRCYLLSPEGISVTFFGVIMILVFAIRSRSFEIRYFNLLSVFFALFAASGCFKIWDVVRRLNHVTVPRVSVMVLIATLWIGIIPVKAIETRRYVNRLRESLISYRLLAAEVNTQYTKGLPIVVGHKPYYYTLETSSPALSIPASDDRFLLAYMKKYDARYVLLTDDEIALWRPQWRSPSSQPVELELITHIGTAQLFRLKKEH